MSSEQTMLFPLPDLGLRSRTFSLNINKLPEITLWEAMFIRLCLYSQMSSYTEFQLHNMF